MKLLAALFLLGTTLISATPEEEAIVGLSGAYSREDGMKEERLILSRDRTYTFITRGDIGSDQETGIWTLRDGHVLLEAKKRGKVFQKKPSKFLVLALHADPLLRVVDESSSEAAVDDPRFFFWRAPEKRLTNRHSQLRGADAPRRG